MSTIASLGVEPALVPPMITTSKPIAASRLSGKPPAAALASRAPSRCAFRPRAFAAPTSAEAAASE